MFAKLYVCWIVEVFQETFSEFYSVCDLFARRKFKPIKFFRLDQEIPSIQNHVKTFFVFWNSEMH